MRTTCSKLKRRTSRSDGFIQRYSDALPEVRPNAPKHSEGCDYRIMLAEKVLKLEDEGRPVTNLQIIARGDKQVAAAKSREIMTEALYKATLERVNVQKLQIKLLSEQLRREWNG